MLGKLKALSAKLSTDDEGNLDITLRIHPESRYAARELMALCREKTGGGKLLTAALDVFRKPRSLDANAYLWVLCQHIAVAVKSTKEEVYRSFIRDVGQFWPLPIREDAIEKFKSDWEHNGLGWFVEDTGPSKLEGYHTILAYSGSSVYDTKEMSVLLEAVIAECRELGIPTDTPEQIALLKESWNEKQSV